MILSNGRETKMAGQKNKTKTSHSLEYEVAGFKARVEITEPGSLIMSREVNRRSASVDVSAYGRGWFLGRTRARPNQVGFSHRGRNLLAPAELYFVIRAFSIVEWRLAPGDLELDFFISRRPLPTVLEQWPFRYAALLTPGSDPFPRTYAEAVTFLRKSSPGPLIDKCDTPSARARAIKKEIDLHFLEDGASLMGIYDRLKMAAAMGSREFRNCYGLSAVQYRNQVRASDSMWDLIIGNRSATDIAHGSGFNDYKRYFAQFKRYAKAPPSAFKGE